VEYRVVHDSDQLKSRFHHPGPGIRLGPVDEGKVTNQVLLGAAADGKPDNMLPDEPDRGKDNRDQEIYQWEYQTIVLCRTIPHNQSFETSHIR